VQSEPQTAPDRQAVRDRWRIGFPNTIVWRSRRARNATSLQERPLVDPYNQSVVKGDYPIKGNNTFFIFSAVSTSAIEQRRAPTPSGVSADDPRSANSWPAGTTGRERNATVELRTVHGDTAFKPRDWAIKISPTFSIPNYVNARREWRHQYRCAGGGPTAPTPTSPSRKHSAK